MRGRFLLGLSNATDGPPVWRSADEVEVELEFDPEPRVVVEPVGFTAPLAPIPIARAAFDRLPTGASGSNVRAIESAK